MPASVLNSYIKGERWREPPVVETRTVVQTVVPKPPAAIPTAPPAPPEVEVTIPLTIRISLGQPVEG